MASTFGGDRSLGARPPEGHPPAEFYDSSQQTQILIIALTGVNIFAAVLMAGSILWDTRTAYMMRQKGSGKNELGVVEEKGEGRNESDGGRGEGRGLVRGIGLEVEQRVGVSESSKRLISEKSDTRALWEMVPAIELFPLILAVAIFVQGIMLAVVEGKALNVMFFEGNCRFISEVAWVALWITPYVVLSFTIEAAIRALSQPRFQPRSGKAVLYCILFASILTILTWIPSRIMPENMEEDICSGQLMSFVDQFAAGGLGIMAALLPLALFMGGVVVMHLAKDVAVDEVERLACSRTIHFLIINVLQWILMVPNYVLTAQNHPKFSTSELATVVVNIGGIAASGLHIYIRTKNGPAYVDEKRLSSIHLGANKPTNEEKESRINKGNQGWGPMNDPQKSFPSRSPDAYTISEPSRNSATGIHSDHLKTTSMLRVPRSPTSVYSRGHNSTSAPSVFSQYTAHSFRRLGDEINNMIAGLRAADRADPPTNSQRPPVSPIVRKPAFNYTLFPPNIDRPRTPLTSTPKPQISIPVRTLSQLPTRPSRIATPAVNMDRRQPNSERQQSMGSNGASKTPKVPKSAVRTNSTGLRTHPAKPFEVAIPPRVDDGDAESFREILIWKKDKTTLEGNRL